MKLETMLLWKRGSFEQFEKIIKEQEKLHKKVYKLSSDIEFEEDAMELLKGGDEEDYVKYKKHEAKWKELTNLQFKFLEKIKENNNQLEKEFY